MWIYGQKMVCKERLQINANCSVPKSLTYGVVEILHIQMGIFLCSIFKHFLKERMPFSALNDIDKTTTELGS